MQCSSNGGSIENLADQMFGRVCDGSAPKELMEAKTLPLLEEEAESVRKALASLGLSPPEIDRELQRLPTLTVSQTMTEAGCWHLLGERMDSVREVVRCGLLCSRIKAVCNLRSITSKVVGHG